MLSCRDHQSRAVLSPVGRQVLLRCLRLIVLLRLPWLVVSVSQQRGSGSCPVCQLLLRFSLRFNRPDLGSDRALAQNSKAASRARFGRSPTAAPSGSGDSAALVELRDGFLPLSDVAVGRTTAAAPRIIASDA